MSEQLQNTDLKKYSGRCLCGAVQYQVRGCLREIVNCHCSQCRRSHGHFAAYTAVTKDQLSWIKDVSLHWFQSSKDVKRGFCRECGSSLFWLPENKDYLCIAAGSLNQPTNLRTTRHIFVDDAADYYHIKDDLEQFDGSMNVE